MNREIRAFMYDKISGIYSNFIHLNDEDKFIFLMANTDRRILNWLGKFVYQSFQIRIASAVQYTADKGYNCVTSNLYARYFAFQTPIMELYVCNL